MLPQRIQSKAFRVGSIHEAFFNRQFKSVADALYVEIRNIYKLGNIKIFMTNKAGENKK